MPLVINNVGGEHTHTHTSTATSTTIGVLINLAFAGMCPVLSWFKISSHRKIETVKIHKPINLIFSPVKNFTS